MIQRIAGRRLWAIALAVGLLGTAALAVPAAYGKKVNLTKTVAAPIPDAGPGATGIVGQLESMIVVPKQGKAKKVRDVNVTISAAGAVGITPISDLEFRLYGPGGQHTLLWDQNASFLANNLTLGPLTLDDEARLELGSGNPVRPNALYAPWSGSATPEAEDVSPMNAFDNGPAAGTWTLNVLDVVNTETSVFNSWSLSLVTGKPFLTKVPSTKK